MIGIFESDNGSKERVKSWINEFKKEFSQQIAQELAEIMNSIYEEALEECPKETGALASSIRIVEGAGEGAGISESLGGGGEEIFCYSIVAGSDEDVNPKTGKPTSEYAMLVHDGHLMRDGSFWEGVPFLTDAIAKYEAELEECVQRALSELNANQQE